MPSEAVVALCECRAARGRPVGNAHVVAVEGLAGLAGQALVEFVQVGAVAVSISWSGVGGGRSALGESSGVGGAAHGLVGHSALVNVDVEVAVHTPASSPRVLDDPVVAASAVVAPADDLDCVATGLSIAGLLVHTGRLRKQVVLDGEASHQRTVCHEFLLDCSSARK